MPTFEAVGPLLSKEREGFSRGPFQNCPHHGSLLMTSPQAGQLESREQTGELGSLQGEVRRRLKYTGGIENVARRELRAGGRQPRLEADPHLMRVREGRRGSAEAQNLEGGRLSLNAAFP